MRITLMHYKTWIISNYQDLYIPTQLETKGLEMISNPQITQEQLDKLLDLETTRDEVQKILNNL